MTKKGAYVNMNPYEILGVSKNATQDEIKKAYRLLVKKYHPDQYGDNPLKELASEKLQEVNEAYEMLSKGKTNSSNYQSSSSSYSSGSANYQDIRRMIQTRNLAAAEQSLQAINSPSDAEWNFLMGVVLIQKGWYDSGIQHLNTACKLNPNNLEYRQTLNQVSNRGSNYSSAYRTSNTGSNPCDCCCQLFYLDCLCEMCGGDLISCC